MSPRDLLQCLLILRPLYLFINFLEGLLMGLGILFLLHERDVSFTISGSELPWDSSHNK